jgi:hypothetical protein
MATRRTPPPRPRKRTAKPRLVHITAAPPLAPPRGLSVDERAEFNRLAAEYRERLKPDDGPSLVELAVVRSALRTAQAALQRHGDTVVSESGAKKRSPTLALVTALQVRENRLVLRMGFARPDVSAARMQHVARQRERLAALIDRTYATPNGELLAGYDEWVDEYVPGTLSATAKRMAGINLIPDSEDFQ